MASVQRTPQPERLADAYVLRQRGLRGLDVCKEGGRGSVTRVRFSRLHRRAAFGTYTVRRRHPCSAALWLIDPLAGPVAVAVKERWPLGLRYRVECRGDELTLIGARSTYMWEVVADDEVVGDLLSIPFKDGDRRVTLPAGTPVALACFVVAVTELARHNPALRLIDRAVRPLSWS